MRLPNVMGGRVDLLPQHAGFALVEPARLLSDLRLDSAALQGWNALWDDLPQDRYLRDAGAYRSRRHGCFIHDVAANSVQLEPPRAHWQPTTYNALHGGMLRWFEPLAPELSAAPDWHRLISGLGHAFARVAPTSRWYVEAHQFRIDASQGIGRPTPEGAHRDGVDFVAVILVGRRNVIGGETRVFSGEPDRVSRFTMEQPWTALLLEDAQVTHETTPIQSTGDPAVRDTLVITYRANGFQEPTGTGDSSTI